MNMKATRLILAAAFCAALSANAAVVRKLPAETVVEGESISLDAMGANSVRSSNTAVFGAALRESGEAVISGARLGEARLDYVREGQVFASRPITVVPVFWQVLKNMFTDDPEITVDIVGDKVVVGGYTANVDTLHRVDTAKALDSTRIVTQVSYSTAQIAELVKDFLSRAAVTNIGVNVVGREVCLSGRMYDTQSIEQLRKRVEGFVKDFPGMSVNTDELRIYKQKILISIEFVAYDDTISRNLGFSGPEAIKASLSWEISHDYDYKRDRTHKSDAKSGYTFVPATTGDGGTPAHTDPKDSLDRTGEFERTLTQGLTSNAKVGVTGIEAQINLLKRNNAAKTLYSTTLSTQSGIEAEFQHGGTFYINTLGGVGANGDMKEVEYGYIIKATPLIVDANTVNLDFSLDNKQPLSRAADNLEISHYQTKSKYLVRPGESIALSGYKYNYETDTKKGTPWLSNIPWIGPYLFGNTETQTKMMDIMVVVTVNWALDNDSEDTAARLDEMKNRKIEVEMP